MQTIHTTIKNLSASMMLLPMCLGLFVMSLTSCDKEADNISIETTQLQYDGHFFAGLYVPDYNTETSLAKERVYSSNYTSAIESANYLCCDDTIAGNITLDVVNSGSGTLAIKPTEDMVLHLDLLNTDGNAVKDAFKTGPLARIYTSFYCAHEAGLITDDEMDKLNDIYNNYADTLHFSDIQTTSFPLIERGASIVTFDEEQNSFYCKTNLNKVSYTVTSSLPALVKYAQQLLPKLSADPNYVTYYEYVAAALKYIAALPQKSEMSNPNGWMMLQYANYSTTFAITVESSYDEHNVLLDNFSKLVFGSYTIDYSKFDTNDPLAYITDATGDPVNYLWLELSYSGNMLSDEIWTETNE